MNVAEYVVDVLIKNEVTDAFGIPGGVILDLLYAMEDRKQSLCPHLNYNEQASGFAASGYAQVKDSIGVAYATRGPGFTNLVTAMADAYQESIPVVFITSHAAITKNCEIRTEYDQEIDTRRIADSICKGVYRIDELEGCEKVIENACKEANSGRKGPVLLDIASSLWKKEIAPEQRKNMIELHQSNFYVNENIQEQLKEMLIPAKRPVILIGEGVRKSNTIDIVKDFSEHCNIPIISSRCSEDILAGFENYYGYIGSHGIRYANFILSKADFILALGNRMSFPIESKSFSMIFKRANCLRVEIDEAELNRVIPNTVNMCMDLNVFWGHIDYRKFPHKDKGWLDVCNILRDKLYACDVDLPIEKLGNWMKNLNGRISMVCDVGNNEFWVSRAYVYSGVKNRILYSRAFGTLGNALPKAIGVYYATRCPVVCFTGDQGMQMNIQELQYIAKFKIPILIVLINNTVSGMIRTHENMKYGDRYIHTEKENGYGVPDFKKIASAYGILYEKQLKRFQNIDQPMIMEYQISKQYDLELKLPKGNECQNMAPALAAGEYEYFNQL